MAGSNRRDFVEDLAGRIAGMMPSGATEEFQRGLNQMLGSAFSRMDVVSREEFEAQARVLERTAVRLQELESQVAALEAAARKTAAGAAGAPDKEAG